MTAGDVNIVDYGNILQIHSADRVFSDRSQGSSRAGVEGKVCPSIVIHSLGGRPTIGAGLPGRLPQSNVREERCTL